MRFDQESAEHQKTRMLDRLEAFVKAYRENHHNGAHLCFCATCEPELTRIRNLIKETDPNTTMIQAAKVWAKVSDGEMPTSKFYSWLQSIGVRVRGLKRGVVLK